MSGIQTMLCAECGAELGAILFENSSGFICGKCFEKKKKYIAAEFADLVN